MDLDPVVEALERKKDRANLRLAGMELGTALEVELVPDEALERLDATLAGEGVREPYEEGVRDGVRAVISGVIHARRSSAAQNAEEETAAEEMALKPLRGEILDALKQGQTVRPGQVARMLGKDPSQVGKELQAMHDDRLLLEQEFEDPEAVDKRGTYYQLSRRGIRQQQRRQAAAKRREAALEAAKRVEHSIQIWHVGSGPGSQLPHFKPADASPCVINGRERFSRLLATSCAPLRRFEVTGVRTLAGTASPGVLSNVPLDEDD